MMTEGLNPEEVALLIRARKLLKEKGLPNGVDVKTICEIAGVSRKTGYQWANGLKFAEGPPDPQIQEMSRLKSEHEQLKERCRDLEIENEGHRLAWKIHGVDELLAAKKKHHSQSEKEEAVRFLRGRRLALRKAAWLLKVSFSILGDWDKGFDENMRPFHIPDGRGKTAKITLQMVRDIVGAAEELRRRGKRLKVKGFTRHLKEEHGIVLSNKKV
ncbi:MAG: hypothetical protein ABII06_02680 [Pseudomonadota bacterium]